MQRRSVLLVTLLTLAASTPAWAQLVTTVTPQTSQMTPDIVVARLGSDFMVKRLHLEDDGGIWLLSENAAYPPVQITEAMDFEVWGRVTHSIQSY